MKAWFHRQLAGSQFYTNHKLFTALRGENSTYLSINLHGEHKDERCHLLPKTNGGGEERVKLFTEIQRMDNDEESLVRLLIIVLGYLLLEHHHQNQDWEIAAQWSDFKVICELLRQRFEGFKSLEHSMEETTSEYNSSRPRHQILGTPMWNLYRPRPSSLPAFVHHRWSACLLLLRQGMLP